MKLKLTDALIERRKSPETGREEIFDTLVPGFGIRIGQRERAFFFIRRIRGEKVRFSLGQYPAISLHKARTEALEIVDKIKRGMDPRTEARRHTYEIYYRAIRKFINSKSSDQVYWNVTGVNWSFAINRAIVNVHLPKGAEIQQHQAYSGQGVARENDYNVIQAEGTEYRAVTTRSLDPGEGFTIAVSWKKGTVPAVDLEPGSVVKIHGKLVVIPVPNPRR